MQRQLMREKASHSSHSIRAYVIHLPMAHARILLDAQRQNLIRNAQWYFLYTKTCAAAILHDL